MASRDHAPNTCAATQDPRARAATKLPFAVFYAGRDYLRYCGWCFSAILIPRIDLRGPKDEGRIILGALHVEFHFHLRSWRGDFRPGGFLKFWSDAAEISERVARNAGQLA